MSPFAHLQGKKRDELTIGSESLATHLKASSSEEPLARASVSTLCVELER